MNTNSTGWRLPVLAWVFILIGLVLLGKTSYYQIWGGSALVQEPLPQEPAPRGMVVDNHGVPLIVNRHFFQVAATPNLIVGDEARSEVATQLQDLLGLPYDRTVSILYENRTFAFAVLADAISREEANLLNATIQDLSTDTGVFPLQHVYPTPMTRRSYPQGESMAHLTGFVSKDFGGVSGIEEYYDEFLPADGIGLLAQGGTGLDELPDNVRTFLPSSADKDLVLSVDRTIQWILREELRRGIEEFKAVGGTAIVLDPRTSAVLGMVNLPDFDPNRFDEAPVNLYRNPAISEQYEPGSIFKIITMGAALDSGMIEPTTIFTDSGSYTIGDQVIFNSDRLGHGAVSATEALARSLNVVTAQISDAMGPEQFYRYLRQFGFGEATKVDLSGEINGVIKTPSNQEWSRSDLGTNSFGQGLAVTPLQMVNSAAAIANHGKLMQPYVVAARVAGGRVQLTQPAVVRQVITPESAEKLKEMMVEVVETSSVKAQVPGYRVAGKSGTAQIPLPDGSAYESDETIASFVGFAPADNPRFVLLVKMDRPDPTINQWASQTAAPVFSRISQRLLDYMNVPPDTAIASGQATAGD